MNGIVYSGAINFDSFFPTTTATILDGDSTCVHPSNTFFYVGSVSTDFIYVYSINQTTGQLLNVSSISCINPQGICMHPSGKFLYAANSWPQQTVQAFLINQTTGELQSINTYASQLLPYTVICDFQGNFLYAGSQGNTVRKWSIDQSTGALSFFSDLNSTGASFVLSFSYDGKFLFHGNFTDSPNGKIHVISIDQSTNQMSLVNVFSTGSKPWGVASHPTKNFIYAINYSDSSIETFSFDASGYLSSLGVIMLPQNSYNGSYRTALCHPNGLFLYTARSSGEIYCYSIDQLTGQLSFLGSDASFSYATGIYTFNTVPISSNIYLYVCTLGYGTKSIHKIDSISGIPRRVETNVVTNSVVRISNNNTKLYVSSLSYKLFIFDINNETNQLTYKKFITLDASADQIAISNSGNFLYIFYSNSIIKSYQVDQINNTLSFISSYTISGAKSSDDNIIIDPNNKFLYVSSNSQNKINCFKIDQISGDLTWSQEFVFPTGNSPKSMCTDPSGKFLYIANTNSNSILMCQINQSDGSLNSIGSVSVSGGTNPLSIACHPNGRYLLIASYTSGNIQCYSRDPISGQIYYLNTPISLSGVKSVCFNSSGNFFIASSSSTYQLYQFDSIFGTVNLCNSLNLSVSNNTSYHPIFFTNNFLSIYFIDPGRSQIRKINNVVVYNTITQNKNTYNLPSSLINKNVGFKNRIFGSPYFAAISKIRASRPPIFSFKNIPNTFIKKISYWVETMSFWS